MLEVLLRSQTQDMMKFLPSKLQAAANLYWGHVDNSTLAAMTNLNDPTTYKLYRKFANTRHDVGLGANDGEWTALQLGLKPLIREIVPAARWESTRKQIETTGLFTASYPLTISEDWLDGYTCDSDARTHRENRVNQGDHKPEDPYVFRVDSRVPENQRLLTYIGWDRDRLHQAVELDQQLLAYAYTAMERELMTKLGNLLGYPSCCVQAYVSLDRIYRNHSIIGQSTRASDHFEPLLNNLSLTFFHYIGWFPCRYDCPESFVYAQQIDTKLAQTHTSSRKTLLNILSLTRLYWDDRRQVLFVNGAPGSENTYTDFLTPFALDRNVDSAYFDWVFFYDVGKTLLEGNRWEITKQRCFIYNDEQLVGDIGPAPLVLEFGKKKARR